MPQLSDTMTEAKILKWNKKVGDSIKRGDILAEVETDKANLEIEAFEEGYLTEIRFEEGTRVSVGEVIAVISNTRETNASSTSPTPVGKTEEEEKKVTDKKQGSQVHSGKLNGSNFLGLEKRVKASPLAKKVAQSIGIDVSEIQGSGPHGRVIIRDIHSISSNAPKVESAKSENLDGSSLNSEVNSLNEELSGMRRAIAQGMVKSFSEIPHFYIKASVQVDRLLEFRANLKELPVYANLSITHIILKTLGNVIREFPSINVKFDGKQIIRHTSVDIGIVVGVDDGLVVPILKRVDEKNLAEIIADADLLISKARQRKLSTHDLSGGCFAVSNLGMFGVEDFSAIIYPGHVGILAVSSTRKVPIVENEQIKIVNSLNLTASFDHRVVDGILGANFVNRIKKYLEHPELILA